MIELASWEDPIVGFQVEPFNWRLRKAREARGWTRAELARRIGVSPGTVGDAEKLQHVSPATREKIALCLEIPEDVLFPGVIDQLLQDGPRQIEIPLEEAQVARWIEDGEASLDAGVLRDELASGVRGALALLPPRQREVLEWRYGLGGRDPETYAEVGQRVGVTRERVRQLEAQALRRLRSGDARRAFAGYVDDERRSTPDSQFATWLKAQRRDRYAPEHIRSIASVALSQPCCAAQPNAAELRLHIRDIHAVNDGFWPAYDDFKRRWEQGPPARLKGA